MLPKWDSEFLKVDQGTLFGMDLNYFIEFYEAKMWVGFESEQKLIFRAVGLRESSTLRIYP